ncbi:hypothetical protein [Burkholderia plantarii]|uniref:Uncharacterized protein n=1 Tax=Burkholderia plantarii TaxID=41899 RepID=A0A0B6S1L2_BURPL|nr:hypothetical protein [Burkholderia plantarii]AJK49553.1 hypothetical protein BGL_2c14860 [Burkholderia plantarii]
MRKTWVIIYPADYSFDAPPHAFRMCPGGPAAQAGSGRKAGTGPRRRSPALPVGLATRRHAAIIRYAAAGIEEIVAPISSIPAGSLPIARHAIRIRACQSFWHVNRLKKSRFDCILIYPIF